MLKLLVALTLVTVGLAQLVPIYDINKNIDEYAKELGFNNFELEFLKFKIDHQKHYTESEEQLRKYNFLSNLVKIRDHNEKYKRGDVTHYLGVTRFSDLTEEEYHQQFSMPIPKNWTVVNFDDVKPIANAPASFDWRAQGKMTPVKNQGGCGSCWAFATNGAVEASYAIHRNQRVSLSEQQMVDCMNTNCGGQAMNAGFDYIQKNGIESDGDYHYEGRAGPCRNNGGRGHYKIARYGALGRGAGRGPASDEEIMNAVMQFGPLAIAFDAQGNDYGQYRGGVLNTGACQWKAVHANVIVGWGQEGNNPYWILKNSWGPGWGEGGYVRMHRTIRCVNEWLYYPVL